MKSKTVLVTSLAAATLGLVSLVDTAGVLPFSVQTVQADSIIAVGNVDHKVDLSLVGYDNNNGVSIKFSTDSINPNFVDNDNSNQDFIIVRTRLVNAKTKEVLQEETGASVKLRSYDLTKSSLDSYSYDLIPDGEYKYEAYEANFYIDPQTKLRHKYRGESPVFRIKDKKFAGLVSSTPRQEKPKQEKPKQEKPTPTPTPTVQSGWSGNSYYQNGQKVINKWVFDVHYNSYYFINVNGNYVQNAWSGNYYLKSNGKMAKSEWIYDKNYGSYYYLTAEGSYARNTWVGNYYLKSDGKMAKSEWIYDKNYGSYYYLTAEGSYARNAWSGNYYLKSNGKMAKGEWVYDSNYKSYYYLTAEGSYARNTWVGNYYLKSNGKMAKGEWIYDNNYGSYYYLTSEGSYARSTWVGDYYLKSNGKMAVNERTPDGYQVDGSGKWISSEGTHTASSSQATSLGISLYHVNDAMTYIDIALPSTPSSSYKVDYDFALVDANTGSVSTQTQFTVTYNPSLRAFQTRHFFSATPDGSYRFVIKGKGQDGKVYDGQSVVFSVKNHRFVR